MSKKQISIILVISLVLLSLISCGSDSKEESSIESKAVFSEDITDFKTFGMVNGVGNFIDIRDGVRREYLINEKGERISNIYNYISFPIEGIRYAVSIDEGKAYTSDDKLNFFYINEKGEEIYKTRICIYKFLTKTIDFGETPNYALEKGGDYLLNEASQKLNTFVFYRNGYFLSLINDENGEGCVGLIDKNGKEVLPPKYLYIGKFFNNRALIFKHTGESNDEFDIVSGFIDENFKEVIPPQFDSASDFNKERSMVMTREKKHGLIDVDGNEIIPTIYKSISMLSDDLYSATKENYQGIDLINKDGEIIKSYSDYDYFMRFNNELSAAVKGNHIGSIDEKGKVVIEPKYSFLTSYEDGLSVVIYENEEGQRLVNTMDKNNDYTFDLSNDDYPVIVPYGMKGKYIVGDENNHYGVVDKSGKVIVDLKYKDIFKFSDGVAFVKKMDDSYNIIDSKGNEIIIDTTEFSFGGRENIYVFNDRFMFRDYNDYEYAPIYDYPINKFKFKFDGGIALINLEEGMAFINKKGEVVSEIFDEIYRFSDGLSIIKDTEEYYGFIDKTGKTVIETKYRMLYPFIGDKAMAVLEDENGNLTTEYIDKSGNVVITEKK